MGRRIPVADNNHNLLLLIHPLLYYSFLAATLAASIVIIAALCGVRSRKKPSSPPPSDHLHTTKHLDAGSPPTNESGNKSNEIPLPPAMQQPKESAGSTSNMRKANSEHRSLSSLKKGPRNLSVSKSGDLKEDGRKKEKLKPEESVWMKTIILGEKCVPDEEDNAVIYEGKGKKISAYHPRNSSSFSISKQLSSISQDLSPDSNPQNDV
ncbi:hypothetical protein K1719_010845 [Acacia pycnantha]|nr:hypothetical protein K1719_010845 [Acacia pycnantha]